MPNEREGAAAHQGQPDHGEEQPPLFSIFIPVWNGSRWIDKAIRSVLAQTYPGWELIIGDNASTDDLAAVVGRFDDRRLRLHRWSTHTDLCENFNRTMLLSRYPWVQPLGADDRLHPRCLEVIAARLRDTIGSTGRLSAVLTAVRRVDSEGRPADKQYYGYRGSALIPPGRHDAESWFRHTLSGVTPWNIGSVVLSRELIVEMGGLLRPEIGLCADVDLMLRASAYGDMLYIDEPLLDFTVRGDADSQSRGFTPQAWRRPLSPLGVALVSGLEVHEQRRLVSRRERDAIHAVVARMQVQRAFQHRYCPGGRGRIGALIDVARAARWSPSAVLQPKTLAYALTAIMGPQRLIAGARRRVLKQACTNPVPAAATGNTRLTTSYETPPHSPPAP